MGGTSLDDGTDVTVKTEDERMLKMVDYDDCILGICSQFGRPDVIAYDLDKVIAKLQADGMTEEEAWDFWSFNQVGAWVGDYTPVFVRVGDVKDYAPWWDEDGAKKGGAMGNEVK